MIYSVSKSVLLSMCALLSYANWMKSTTTGENDAIEPNTQYNRNTFVHIIISLHRMEYIEFKAM